MKGAKLVNLLIASIINIRNEMTRIRKIEKKYGQTEGNSQC